MSKIPKTILQTWKTHNVPEDWKPFQDSWKRWHPDWTYRLVTDVDNREFLVKHYPWLVDVYDRLPYPINRVDFIRYVYLYHEGGCYADLDMEALKSLNELLVKHPHDEIMLAYDSMHHLECAFMLSVPRHPLWLDVISSIAQALDRPDWILDTWYWTNQSFYILGLTGPVRLEKVIQSRGYKGVHIFPTEAFYPKKWNEKHKKTHELTNLADAYCVHHMKGSWIHHVHKWFMNVSESSYGILKLVVMACILLIVCTFGFRRLFFSKR